jgi:hypothetical protein
MILAGEAALGIEVVGVTVRMSYSGGRELTVDVNYKNK